RRPRRVYCGLPKQLSKSEIDSCEYHLMRFEVIERFTAALTPIQRFARSRAEAADEAGVRGSTLGAGHGRLFVTHDSRDVNGSLCGRCDAVPLQGFLAPLAHPVGSPGGRQGDIDSHG